MGIFIRHEHCEKCGSSDAKAVYDDGSWYCWSCKDAKASEDYKDQFKSKFGRKERKEKPEVKEPITKEQIREIVSTTSTEGAGFRGIRNEIYAKFGVRHEFDEETRQVVKQYYPVTKEGSPSGYKVRVVEDKDFYSKGSTGRDCDMFMQRHFTSPAKYCLIAEGEVDSLSAYQMLSDYYTNKGTTFEVACVSATTGANSQRQIQNQYKFFDQFDNIVICYDNDEAGKSAVEEIVKVLPKGKIKIMHLDLKDPNEYLKDGKQEEFVRAFFRAEHYVPVGVVGSGMLYERVLNQATMPKIPFPHFMKALNEAMAGGMVLGHTYNIASGTGLGKCLGKDTPVLMSDFSVKMVQDIVNGETVMGPDGLPRIVSGVTSGTAQLYKIKQSDGEDYVVNSDHILSLRNQEGEIWNVNVEEFILESRFYNHKETWFGWRVNANAWYPSSIDVTPCGFGEYFGFQVDKDHLFCLGDGTVTHNTTFINEIIYSWIFNSPYRIGIVSMELDSAQYGEVLLSRHMSKKIALFDDPTEKDKYLRSENVAKKAQELFFDDEQHRFYVLDNRDGTVEEIQNAVEELVISCGCKVIIIDPLQDVLDGLSVDEQAVFMKWVKGMQKSHGIAIVLINHLRKSASGAPSSAKGEDFTEEDIIGSSSIIKSASVNILLSRNKYSDDPVVRNTTKVRVSKNRLTGITGPVGNVYYDNESHTLHDFEEYWGKAQPTEEI